MLSVRVVLAVNVGTDTTINADTTAQQTITADNVTLTNNANINFSGETAIDMGGRSGTIIINNAGTSIKANDDVIRCTTGNNCTGPVILHNFGLRKPLYKQVAAYGHFGRLELDLPWEKTDKAFDLKNEASAYQS